MTDEEWRQLIQAIERARAAVRTRDPRFRKDTGDGVVSHT
jgi:hypothetical protein